MKRRKSAEKSDPSVEALVESERSRPTPVTQLSMAMGNVRRRIGIKQIDLARLLFCPQTTISDYELGRRVPTSVHLNEISMLLKQRKIRL